jgi:predicted aspartyl protease
VQPAIRGQILAADRSWRKLEFLVDTGADRTVLTAAALAQLGLRPITSDDGISGLGGKPSQL